MTDSAFDCVFRADGGPGFGFGHLRRCFVLAEALKRNGIKKIAFISKTKQAAETVLNKRFPVIKISARKHETDFFCQYFKKNIPKLLIVDSYKINAKTLSSFQKLCPVVIFDDTGSRTHYSIDGIINYNVHATTINYACADHTRLLLGTQYVPIDSSFKKLVHKRKNIHKMRLFISLSGMLPAKCLKKINRVLTQLQGPLLIDTTSGLAHNQTLQKNDVHVNWLPFQEANNVMAKADMALCAAGVTSYELAFLGIPLLITSIVKNHEPLARWLDKLGTAKNIGSFVKLSDKKILNEIERFIDDNRGREQMSQKQRRLIDGLGSDRLAKKIIQYWIGS